MSVGYNAQEDKYNPRYEAWAANMLKTSEAKRWNKMVAMDRQSGRSVTVGIVGCLHWAYYSIMHYFGKGTTLQYVLCYYEKGDVVPSDGIDFDGSCNKKGFYKTEGQFCISSVILAMVLLIRKWLRAKVDILGQTYDSGDTLYSMFSRFTANISWIVVALVLFQLFLAVKSLVQGRRFVKYIVNTILILLLPTGFGVVECIFLVGLTLWYWGSEEDRGVQYINFDSAPSRTSSNTVSGKSYSNVKNTVYEKSKRQEDQGHRNNAFEDYEKKRRDEKERQRKEDQRYRLCKEIDGLKTKISILEKNNRDLDAGFKAYQKGSWSYNVDPKANRNKYESNLKEIDWLKKKIEKTEDELRVL